MFKITTCLYFNYAQPCFDIKQFVSKLLDFWSEKKLLLVMEFQQEMTSGTMLRLCLSSKSLPGVQEDMENLIDFYEYVYQEIFCIYICFAENKICFCLYFNSVIQLNIIQQQKHQEPGTLQEFYTQVCEPVCHEPASPPTSFQSLMVISCIN